MPTCLPACLHAAAAGDDGNDDVGQMAVLVFAHVFVQTF
jgi:hypothetical protein